MLKTQEFNEARSSGGFTLPEIMIVVAIAAILMAIALPAYQDYVREARRSDAYDVLLLVQNQQERWRASHTTYGTLTNIGVGNVSLEGFYTVAISGANATSYTATASAVSGTSQASDSGCTSIVIAVNATNPRGSKTPTTCW